MTELIFKIALGFSLFKALNENKRWGFGLLDESGFFHLVRYDG